jgi:hypothetical protein
MPYVTSFERFGMRRMIEDSLRAKFGKEGVALMPAIIALNESENFLTVNRAILADASVDEVRRTCAKLTKNPTPH